MNSQITQNINIKTYVGYMEAYLVQSLQNQAPSPSRGGRVFS